MTSASAALAARHAQGLLGARERIAVLLDADSFDEPARLAVDGVVAGSGTVAGRRVFVYALDATVAGGATTPAHAACIGAVLDQAARRGVPVVSLLDTAGTRANDGLAGIAHLVALQRRQLRARRRIAQLALVMGPCIGAASGLAALADLRIMLAGHASLFLTGPDAAEAATGEIVSAQDLGGAAAHGTRSGLADLVAPNEIAALLHARDCIGYLPDQRHRGAPHRPTVDPPARTAPSLATLVTDNPAHVCDVRELIAAVADEAAFFELQPDFAANLVTAFARLDGRAVGIVANQPTVLAGCLDCDALEKAARFVRLCSDFGLPLITVVDTPGFLPGVAQEHAGIVRAAAHLLAAYAESRVKRITLVVGRAYGGAWGVMAPKPLGTDLVLAWTGADIALRRGAAPADASAAVDDVIAPEQTRPRLCRALAALLPG